MRRMRIATWNINGLRARLDFVLAWLDARQPDLVGLQELKLQEEQFPIEPFAERGYQAQVFGQKAWNGVAVLSKRPVELIEKGLAGQEELGSRLISVRTDHFDFTTVYCPNGKSTEHPDFARKLAWFDALIERSAKRGPAAPPEILCGDFNICPTPLDTCHEPDPTKSIFHTPEERSRIERLLDTGLVDLFRAQHPDARLFSWWDYRSGAFPKNRGLRIDFVLGAQSLSARCRQAEIDRDYRKKKEGLTPSDHAPVMVELGDPGQA